jgi:predicted membrane chloride channel (bestrophin family)
MKFFYSLAAIVALCNHAGAFTPSVNHQVTRVAEKSFTSLCDAPKDISYGEESRKYRRTIYTHDDWVRHRASDRFVRNLNSLRVSGVYKNISKEVASTTAIAAAIVLYNMLTAEYTDFSGVTHAGPLKDALLPVGLPLTPFTLSSSALSLLLVFRTNTAYTRWDEARKNWGMNINHTRDLVRMATAWYDPKFSTAKSTFTMSAGQPVLPRLKDMTEEELAERKEKLQKLSLATWAFVRSMKRHLSPVPEDEEDFKAELFQKLPKETAQKIIDAAHRPNRALFDLSVAIEDVPMHFMRKNEVHKAVTIFEDNLGSSERLLTSPVPLFYTRHTARFITTWLLLLPFALWEPFKGTWNHVGMIPAMAVISVFMFGIEELGIQLEEPFTVLPMQAYCDRIGNWCNEIVSFVPGDNEAIVEESAEKQTAISR